MFLRDLHMCPSPTKMLYDGDDYFPLAQLPQLLQKDQVWNEILARNLSHLEEIELNNSTGVDKIEESNEDVRNGLGELNDDASDSSDDVVMVDIPIIALSTANYENVRKLKQFENYNYAENKVVLIRAPSLYERNYTK
ncbi:hypothetical protein QE152_g33970 [Popillia japonica]|uniref:Uncharacterized protein n=1 Tax=Popillia japonica TaxID=7064 RepID=A0AAW1IUF1_POPJA